MKAIKLLPSIVAVATFLLLLNVADAEDATVVAPNNYTVEFENDAVRVVRIKYAPGDESGMHEHRAGVVVNLVTGNIQFTLPDGTSPTTEPAAAGSSFWSPAGMHAAKNVGSQPFEALLIEVKN